MSTGHLLIGLAVAAAIAGLYCMIRIMMYLNSRGEKVNWFLLRLRWFRYMSRYRELTTEEYGQPGEYLRGYIIFMLSSLILVIAGALLLS